MQTIATETDLSIQLPMPSAWRYEYTDDAGRHIGYSYTEVPKNTAAYVPMFTQGQLMQVLRAQHEASVEFWRERETYAAQAKRLAMELECLLLDCKETAAVSRWWDSAHEALAQFRTVIACEPEAVDAPEAQREASEPVPVRVVIDLDGGLVRNVLSSVPLEYLVFDRDIEGCPEQDVAVRPGLHEGDVQVYRSGYYGADVDSDRIALIYSSLEDSEDASLDAVQPSLGNAQR